jgi:hypothetical protein
VTDGVGDAPIFVVGFRRSGTTLLQALIGSHPRIATPPEMHFLARVASYRELYGEPTEDAVLREVIRQVVRPGYPILDECGFDSEAIFQRLQRGPRTYAAVLDAVMTDFMQARGKQRWCEKTPWQRPSLIWHHFPDARVLHIVRDPRDVVASSLAMPSGPFPDGASTARAWRLFAERSLQDGAFKGPAHYLQVRYEDLTKDPTAVLSLVFAFLGEDFDPSILNNREQRATAVPSMVRSLHGRVLEDVVPAPQGQWREKLGVVDRLRIAPIVAPMLAGLAYEQSRTTTVIAGAVLNALHSPIDVVRRSRETWRLRRLRTPQQRAEADRQLALDRGRRYKERLAQTAQPDDKAAAGHGA